MDANNSFYVKFIAAYAPTILGYIISVLAMVNGLLKRCKQETLLPGSQQQWDMLIAVGVQQV